MAGEKRHAKGAAAGARPTSASAHPLESVLQYHFRDSSLLHLALTHASLAFERSSNSDAPREADTSADNEQLEFVGDAVVGLLVAESLFQHFPNRGEGDLTRMRALIVSRKHMGEVGLRLNLGQHLLLGRGEETSGGRNKPALIANTLEAVIAAIYLDSGNDLRAVRALVEREMVQPRLAELQRAAAEKTAFGGIIGDFKSALQELLQARSDAAEAYYVTTEESGPDHRKHFHVEVRLRSAENKESVLAGGQGGTKKQAQQAAARLAFENLRSQAPPTAPPPASAPPSKKRARRTETA